MLNKIKRAETNCQNPENLVSSTERQKEVRQILAKQNKPLGIMEATIVFQNKTKGSPTIL